MAKNDDKNKNEVKREYHVELVGEGWNVNPTRVYSSLFEVKKGIESHIKDMEITIAGSYCKDAKKRDVPTIDQFRHSYYEISELKERPRMFLGLFKIGYELVETGVTYTILVSDSNKVKKDTEKRNGTIVTNHLRLEDLLKE
ncbi:MAG TPA: hypothetical protein VI894_01940 [Candidatus Nanoarchaeia archaeon]|nr:hypothetical protein [Candidatus Nanoarchaeia archaeon]